MTRLLDRYVLGIFIPALALFTLTLLFLFIAVDCAAKLGKFLELQGQPILPFVLKYYLVRIPMLLIILIPSVMLFAPTFTVIKLARANEILPIATSGISLRRMSLPFLVAAVLGALSMAAMDEFVLPRIGDQIRKTDADMSIRGERINIEDYDGTTKIWAEHFSAPKELLTTVRITQLDPSMQPDLIITAKRCQWSPKLKRWIAFEGYVEKPKELVYPVGEKPHTWKEPIPAEGTVIEAKLTPETLRKDMGTTSRVSFVPLSVLINEMHRNPRLPGPALQVHARFAFPLSPIVLLLLGLPFVMDPNSKSFIKGLIFCFLLALGFYLTHFACSDLGYRGSIPPLIGAWLPIWLFGAAGLVAFSRMKT
jgi:lipopolysaccharide export system permease protein